MFKKFLVPLKGSEQAGKILPYIANLAKTRDSRVTLLHLYGVEVDEALPGVLQGALAQEKRRCELMLDEAAKYLVAQGVKEVKVECLGGSPAREIIAYAESNDIDLIALATRGKSEVAWVLGSVAEKVVTHATVPVLLIIFDKGGAAALRVF